MIRDNETTTRYAGTILALLLFAQLVMSMGAYAWGPLAPFIRDAYGVSRAQIGFLTSALYLTSVLVAVPSGLVGFTAIGWNALLMISGAEIVGPELAGSFTGISVAIAWVGIVSGPPVFGYLVDIFSYRTAWTALSLAFFVASVGIACMYLLDRRKASDQRGN